VIDFTFVMKAAYRLFPFEKFDELCIGLRVDNIELLIAGVNMQLRIVMLPHNFVDGVL
jgi:hypothetical protein